MKAKENNQIRNYGNVCLVIITSRAIGWISYVIITVSIDDDRCSHTCTKKELAACIIIFWKLLKPFISFLFSELNVHSIGWRKKIR